MGKPMVSIIIPVFNVEKYLDRCVKSLVSQQYENLEIILVDDGATDDSGRLCDIWVKSDHRIKVIHKKNEGQGIARNDGMDISKGDYFCFIDSDDYLDSDVAISSLVDAAEKEQAEIVVFGLKKIAANGTIVSRYIPKVGRRTYRGKEVLEEFLPEFISMNPKCNSEKLFYMSSCVLMYSARKIKEVHWKYVSERAIVSEDVYSILNLFDSINTVTVVPEDYYCYCTNDSSSFSRKYVPNRYEKIRHFYLEAVSLCEKKKYGEDIVRRVADPFLAYSLATLKQEANAPASFWNRKKIVYGILSDSILQQVVWMKKGDQASFSRKLLYFLIRNKYYFVCFLLCTAKK